MSTIDWYNPVVKQATLTRANITQTTLFTLPADSKIVSITIQTAIAAVGANLDVGIPGATDRYLNGVDVSAQGQVTGSILVEEWLTAATLIVALVAGAAPAGGPFSVTCTYINRKSTRLT